MKSLRNLVILYLALTTMMFSVVSGQETVKDTDDVEKVCPLKKNIDTIIGGKYQSISPPHNEVSIILNHKDDLNLSDKQIKEIEYIEHNAKKKMISFKADIDLANLDLSILLDSQNPEMRKAEKIVRKIASLESDSRMQKIRASANALAHLKSEQRASFEELDQMGMCSMKANAEMMMDDDSCDMDEHEGTDSHKGH